MERRLEVLERNYTHLQASLTKIEIMQHATEQVLDSRHRALEKGQEIILVKVDNLSKDITTMAGEAERSPAGRAIVVRIIGIEEEQKSQSGQLKELMTIKSEIRGALRLVQYLTVSAVLTAILAILKSFGLIHP